MVRTYSYTYLNQFYSIGLFLVIGQESTPNVIILVVVFYTVLLTGITLSKSIYYVAILSL